MDYLAIKVEEALLDVALLVSACHEPTCMGGEIRCEGSVYYEPFHFLQQGILVLRWNNKSVHPILNDFPTAIDVCHDRRQSHRSSLYHHVGESFPVAREHQGV